MNAGYVRLSRDDDKRNYVSIENQKLIINQYAALTMEWLLTDGMKMTEYQVIFLTDRDLGR